MWIFVELFVIKKFQANIEHCLMSDRSQDGIGKNSDWGSESDENIILLTSLSIWRIPPASCVPLSVYVCLSLSTPFLPSSLSPSQLSVTLDLSPPFLSSTLVLPLALSPSFPFLSLVYVILIYNINY